MAALSGLRVLELANVLAGPAVGCFLAELGAEVVKVENPRTGGDVTRGWKLPGENAETDVSAYFSAVNWGKRSVGVDLGHPQGLALVRRLAAGSDVVVASYKPGDAERLGVGYSELSALQPRLVYALVTGYGAADPRAGYDAVIQAEAGFTYLNGPAGGPTTKMPVALMDLLAAHQLKEGVLLALLERERTGRGQLVETSLLRSGVASLANQATNWLSTGEVPRAMGSDHPNIAPYGALFPTADSRQVVLAVGTDGQFARLCAALEAPELAADPRFATNAARVLHRAALHETLEELTRRLTRQELLARLARDHVPAGGVLTLPEVFAQPEVAALLLRRRDEAGRELVGVRTVAFSGPGLPLPCLPPPPRYAAHTEEVLRQDLGLTAAEIDELRRAGAIEAQ